MVKRLRLHAEPSNWIAEGRAISDTLSDMPSGPPAPGTPRVGTNYLRALADGDSLTKWPLRFSKAKALLRLQRKIGWHLSYRLQEHHKIRRANKGDFGEFGFVGKISPESARTYFDELTSRGVRFVDSDLWAVRAHLMLGRVLVDHFVSDDRKRTLPLAVASIASDTVSRTAIRAGARPRRARNNALKEAKFRALAARPSSSWKDLLDILEGEEIVTLWTHKAIQWNDPDDGEARTTATGTFRNWKQP
jgi:hypothetical protein